VSSPFPVEKAFRISSHGCGPPLPPQSIAIVAHGGTNRAILCRALGLPLARLLAFGQDYAALTVLETIDGAWRLRVLNEQPD